MSSDKALSRHYEHADQVMLMICYGLALGSFALAFWYDTWLEAIVIGGGTSLAMTGIFSLVKGSEICRISMGAAFMVLTALHIHQAHGMIEVHFGVFALLAMLLFYRDWLPIISAATVIAVHHILFYILQSSGSNVWVLSSSNLGFWVIALHAGYVICETALLVWFAKRLKSDAIQAEEIMIVTNRILEHEKIDLTQRTSGQTDLLIKFDKYTSDVENLAKQVLDNSIKLVEQGTELTVATNEMKESSLLQQQETDMIATAVEEMSTAIIEVTNHAELAAEASRQIDINAQEATQVSERTQNDVQSLAEKVCEAVQTIESLNNHANSIGSVLDVIRGIAEQTNLLALNAAIEAARAGEQGRGFAVVADEVRTLAQRTQQSTQEIDHMIEKLQSGSSSAVKAIELSRAQAEDCVVNTSNSLGLMEQVSGAIQEINQMNTMIATAASEQSAVTNEISRNVSNILAASNRAADGSSGVAGGALALHEISNELSTISDRFLVSRV